MVRLATSEKGDENMAYSQCLISQGNRILLVTVRQDGQNRHFLPGGSALEEENLEEAALRHLYRQCGVQGRLLRILCTGFLPGTGQPCVTYEAEIGKGQQPTIRNLSQEQRLTFCGADFFTLKELSERDRAMLWAAGLAAVPAFFQELERFGGAISYPVL